MKQGADDGFFERFGLKAYPGVSNRPWQQVDKVLNFGARVAYKDICQKLAETNWQSIMRASEFDNGLPYCRLDADAQSAFDKWQARTYLR